jgi:hypothetical protein
MWPAGMFKNPTIHKTLFKARPLLPVNWNILHLPMKCAYRFCLLFVLLVCAGTYAYSQDFAMGAADKDEDAIKLRLMMVDATLELNETLLQGVNASVDTLNLPENTNVIQDKDMQVTLIRMKRARDKALLMPFLEHMKDSLNEEVTILRKEKTKLEAMIKPAEPVQPVVLKTQTLVSKKDTLVLETTLTETGAEQTLITNVKTNEKIVISDDMTASERKANERAHKGVWGMSWRQKAMKGVEGCEKPGEVVKRALIPGFPNDRSLNT